MAQYPQKVVFVGGYIWIASIANLLVKRGIEVHIIPIQKTRMKGLSDKVHFHGGLVDKISKNAFKKLITHPMILLALKRKLKQIKPDILHAFYVQGNGWFAALSGFHPFVLTSMGGDISIARGAYKKPIRRWFISYAARKADVFTVVTDDGYQQISQYVPNLDREFFRAGFDPAVFHKSEKPGFLCEKYGLNGDFVVLSPRGFASRNYNIETIIKGFHGFHRNVPNSKLLLAGADEVGYRTEIERLVSSLGLDDAVIQAGLIQQERLNDYYNLADVVVSVPFDDGFPATVTEAYACGKPLIVAKNNSINEIFADGENGYVIDPNDARALAERLMQLNKNPELYNKIAEYNLKRSREYDMNYYVQHILRVYSRLITNRNRQDAELDAYPGAATFDF